MGDREIVVLARRHFKACAGAEHRPRMSQSHLSIEASSVGPPVAFDVLGLSL